VWNFTFNPRGTGDFLTQQVKIVVWKPKAKSHDYSHKPTIIRSVLIYSASAHILSIYYLAMLTVSQTIQLGV
jgi:hypothetical protein